MLRGTRPTHARADRSRRYNVWDDHTLTAVDPPGGLNLDNLHISASELPSFLACAGFKSEIGMAMFVQILGHETNCRDHSAFRIEAGEVKILIDPSGPITRPGTTDGAAALRQELDKGR